jgi:hypothetical protein
VRTSNPVISGAKQFFTARTASSLVQYTERGLASGEKQALRRSKPSSETGFVNASTRAKLSLSLSLSLYTTSDVICLQTNFLQRNSYGISFIILAVVVNVLPTTQFLTFRLCSLTLWVLIMLRVVYGSQTAEVLDDQVLY